MKLTLNEILVLFGLIKSHEICEPMDELWERDVLRLYLKVCKSLRRRGFNTQLEIQQTTGGIQEMDNIVTSAIKRKRGEE